MKKIIAVVLLVCMLLSCVAGCSENGNQAERKAKTETKEVEFNISDYDLEDIEQKTQAVKDYLQSIYGKYTLSGQVFGTSEQKEGIFIYSETGEVPAIASLDLAGMEWDETADATIGEALDWHQKYNGLVELHWHWAFPSTMSDYSDRSAWIRNMKNGKPNVSNILLEGTAEHELAIEHIDMIAGQLKRLQNAKIPVLWRPLHEASGGWFWWGQSAYSYKALWTMMYDRLMNYHKLENLIWVWNGQNADWMPDPDTFDIGGYDNYSEEDSTIKDTYDWMNKCTNGKMLAITECAMIPRVDEMRAKKTPWLYWITWYGDFVYSGENGNYTASKYTPLDKLKANYNSKYVINLDDLPLWGKDNKRDLPSGVQYYKETGYIPGNTPKWKDGELTLEFELGNVVGCLLRGNDSSASASGYLLYRAYNFEDEVFVPFNVPKGQAGDYTATVRYKGSNGTKLNTLIVNGLSTGTRTYLEGDKWDTIDIDVELKEGVNYLGYSYRFGGWGYISIDCVTLKKKR